MPETFQRKVPGVDATLSPQREADRLYRAIFGRAAPAIVAERFAVASARLNEASDEDEVRRYYWALEHIGDLEALEVAARYGGALEILSKKFRVIVYLAEMLPENNSLFVNEKDRFPRGMWSVFAGAVRTAVKLAKGKPLARRVRRA